MSQYNTKDVKNAFKKLLSNTYFDGNDLFVRDQITTFLDNGGEKKLAELSKKIAKGPASFTRLFNQISLRYLPKKIEENNKEVRNNLPSNFISNHFVIDGSTVKRSAIFCVLPIELHIVTIIWITKYGYLLDKKLTNSCYGNRLMLPKGKVMANNRTLFKPYVKQFKKWWSLCISSAEKLLSQKEDVTVINFDLKNYYHSIELNFDVLEEELIDLGQTDIKNDPLHKIFRKIHVEYAERLKAIKHPSFHAKANLYPLPIGALSSYTLANWYLREFDEKITKELIPTYYGRYVDDILIVLKGRLITKFDDEIKDNLKKDLKRYKIDIEQIDNNTCDKTSQADVLNYFVIKYLKDILTPTQEGDEINYQLTIETLKNIKLQKEKFFIYQFDAKLSPSLINKFIEDQKDRSSEFRFLSDEEDESFDDFEENIFESNFENTELNKARFKQVEENKFRLSVYLAKFIRRILDKGADYKKEEIEKIEKYFQGIYLLKHHYFWEKLLTLHLVANRKESFLTLVKHIYQQIDSLKVDPSEASKIDEIDVKVGLMSHLISSIEMALGLDPNFIDSTSFDEFNLDIDSRRYRRHALLRKQYIYFPLIHLTKRARTGSDSLITPNLFSEDKLFKWIPTDFQTKKEWIPYRIKFYEAAIFTFYKNLLLQSSPQDPNLYRSYQEFVPVLETLDEAFYLFYDINISPNDTDSQKERLRNKYFQPHDINKQRRSRRNRNNNFDLEEIYIPNSTSQNTKYNRIALINKYVDFKDYENSLKGKPNLDKDRIETFNYILDEVGKVKKCDLFIQPELSLPHNLIYNYAKFSARRQIGFISGVEHIRVFNLGFNFIISCLPINMDGDYDAIPMIRLKNHYAPIEESWMNDQFIVVPKPKTYKYQLFEWRGMYFSSYYCFELADVFHRAALFSMVDLIVAPIWNQDVLYYNNIVESTTRDLHCYFIQVNASQYGETRVTRPTGHTRRDKARVTGGTTDDHKVTILVSDIDIKTLRSFQQLKFPAQKELNKDNKSFKPTPPDFPVNNAARREKGERFGDLIPLGGF